MTNTNDTKQIALERIGKAQSFLLTAPPSKWAIAHEREKTIKHLYDLFEFLKPVIEGETIIVEEVQTEPKRTVIEETQKVFPHGEV